MKKQIDPFKQIKEELNKYPIATLHEFVKRFPCVQKNYYLPSLGKLPPSKTIILKGRSVGATTMVGGIWGAGAIYSGTWMTSHLSLPNDRKLMQIWCASANEFWNRWNRFKNLKAFL